MTIEMDIVTKVLDGLGQLIIIKRLSVLVIVQCINCANIEQ